MSEIIKLRKQVIIVKGLVYNNDKVLLVRRNREWHVDSHNKWEFPGGKIEFGESPETAVLREISEESGYATKVISLNPKIISATWTYTDRESQQILICYICELIGGQATLGDPGVSEIRWFDIEEALKLECLPGTKEFLEEYKKIKR